VTPLVNIEILGDPVAWARAGKGGKKHYTKPKQAAHLEEIGLLARQAMKGRPASTAALLVDMSFYMAIGTSWSKKKQAQAAAGTIRPTATPDLDNLEKQINDGLEGIVFNNDSQVVEHATRKVYAGIPKTVIRVYEVAQASSDKARKESTSSGRYRFIN